MENLLEFLTSYTMGMDKIIDNMVPTKKAKVHTRKVCQQWYDNILTDQKTKVHRRGDDLSDHASSDVISENLADFFLNKILKIRDNLEQYDLYTYE